MISLKDKMEIYRACAIVFFILSLTLIYSIVFAGERTNKWDYYKGKNVKITMTFNLPNSEATVTLVGKVLDVSEIDICKQEDSLGNCVMKDYFYTLFVRSDGIQLSLDCDRINTIEEIK